MTRLWLTLGLETGRCLWRRHLALLVVLTASVIGAAGLLAAKVDASESVLLGISFYAPFALGLVVMSGLVSDERASGLVPGAAQRGAEAGQQEERMEPLGRAEFGSRQCDRLAHSMSARIDAADVVADLGGAVRRQAGQSDDAVVGAGGVDDQAWRCRTSCRAGRG